MPFGRKNQHLSIGTQNGTFLVSGGVDPPAQVEGLRPSAIRQAHGSVQIPAAFSARTIRNENPLPTIKPFRHGRFPMARVYGETQLFFNRPTTDVIPHQLPYAALVAKSLVRQQGLVIANDAYRRHIAARHPNVQPHRVGPSAVRFHRAVDLPQFILSLCFLPVRSEIHGLTIGGHHRSVIRTRAVQCRLRIDGHRYRIAGAFHRKIAFLHHLQSPQMPEIPLGITGDHYLCKRLSLREVIRLLQHIKSQLERLFWREGFIYGKGIVALRKLPIHGKTHQRNRLSQPSRDGPET